MVKKSKNVYSILLVTFTLSLVFCGLGLTGYASSLPLLNDIDLNQWGNIYVYASPSSHTFWLSYHNNNGLQADLSGSPFVGSDGASVGVYVGTTGSTTVSVTVYDASSGNSESTTASVYSRQITTINLNVDSSPSVTPAPTVNPITTPNYTPPTVTLSVNPSTAYYGQSVTFTTITSPAITGTYTVTAKVNGVFVYSTLPLQLDPSGTSYWTMQPSSTLPTYNTVSWSATVNGVESNSVQTVTLTPTEAPTQNTPIPSSTPTTHIDLPIESLDINNEVATVGAISSIISAIALVWYHFKK